MSVFYVLSAKKGWRGNVVLAFPSSPSFLSVPFFYVHVFISLNNLCICKIPYVLPKFEVAFKNTYNKIEK